MHFLISAVDTGLGRFSKEAISQQSLMELCVQDIPPTKRIAKVQTEMGDFFDIDKWFGVELNADGDVVKINWAMIGFANVNMAFFPSTVKRLILVGNELSGTVPWAELPDALEILGVALNSLEGSASFDQLPGCVKKISLIGNRFSGSLLLDCLPAATEAVTVSRNQFTGTVDLAHIPAGCLRIDASDNKLTGGVDVSMLPHGLESLNLSSNMLSGTLELTSLPAGLRNLNLKNNAFEGDICIGALHEKLVGIWISSKSKIRFVDGDGNLVRDVNRLHIERFDAEW